MTRRYAPISEVGGLLLVPGRKSRHGNPVAIQHGQDGYDDPIFELVEVWEAGGVSSLDDSKKRKTWKTLGEAVAANPPVRPEDQVGTVTSSSFSKREERVTLAEKLQSRVYEVAKEARRLVEFTNDPEDENIESLLFGPLESAAMSFDELILSLRSYDDPVDAEVPRYNGHAGLPAKIAPAADKVVWKTLARNDPRSAAAVEAIRAVYRAAQAKAGKPFPYEPVVNRRKISKDGTRVKGMVIPMGAAFEACPTGEYTAEMPR